MDHERVLLPRTHASAWRKLATRLVFALALIVFVALVCYLDRDGYSDSAGDGVSLLDAFYYASVSVTTTGYGDIAPVSDTARLLTLLLTTPARVLFLILLVGTTVELLTAETLWRVRHHRWRKALRDHVIICGFGTKGRTAAQTLLRQGVERDRIVAVDASAERVAEAEQAGIAAIRGDAARFDVLDAAGIADAAQVIVAVARDDTAVLVTLTAREHNPTATIVAAAREDENAHLLHQSGASSVVRTASAAGRMLGLGSQSPQLVDVLEDLTTIGQGIDLVERPVHESECGREGAPLHGSSVIAVVRDGRSYRFDDPAVAELRPGDRLVCLQSHAVA